MCPSNNRTGTNMANKVVTIPLLSQKTIRKEHRTVCVGVYSTVFGGEHLSGVEFLSLRGNFIIVKIVELRSGEILEV
jgi:hypothetical protein